MNPILANLRTIQDRIDELKNSNRHRAGISGRHHDDLIFLQFNNSNNNNNNKPLIVDELSSESSCTDLAEEELQDELYKPVSVDIFDDDHDVLEPLPLSTTVQSCGDTDDLPLWLIGNFGSEISPSQASTFAQPPSDGLARKHRRCGNEENADDITSNTNKRRKAIVSDDEEGSTFLQDQWSAKFQDLLEFKKQHGHCRIPHTYEKNQSLARWVKRQRYQYKLSQNGKKTTMAEARQQLLTDVGFVWDSHSTAWQDRIQELEEYCMIHGNTNVPGNYSRNPKLSTWVKCQRRQYKLYNEGRPSNITPSRINDLEQLGFEWTIRTATTSSSSSCSTA